MNALELISKDSLKAEAPEFSVGDTAEYHIGSSLGSTQAGDFYITGRNKNASRIHLLNQEVNVIGW